jgi:hypothetical protein
MRINTAIPGPNEPQNARLGRSRSGCHAGGRGFESRRSRSLHIAAFERKRAAKAGLGRTATTCLSSTQTCSKRCWRRWRRGSGSGSSCQKSEKSSKTRRALVQATSSLISMRGVMSGCESGRSRHRYFARVRVFCFLGCEVWGRAAGLPGVSTRGGSGPLVPRIQRWAMSSREGVGL